MLLSSNEQIPRLPEQKNDLLSKENVEGMLVDTVSYLQKWGLLICLVLVVLMLLLSFVATTRKNPKLVRSFKYFAYGFALIGIVFVFLPYFVLVIPGMSNDQTTKSTLEIVLHYVRAWELLICAYVVMISILFAYTAKIRNNIRLNRKYSFFAYGALIMSIVLFFMPAWILNYLA